MSMDIAEAAMGISVHVGIGNWYQKMGISIDHAITVIVTCINKLVRLPSYFFFVLLHVQQKTQK